MKKNYIIVFVFIILCILIFGRPADFSFEKHVEDMVMENHYEGIEEILAVIEFDDAQFGLSLIKCSENRSLIYLSSILFDKKERFSALSHGGSYPIIHTKTEDENGYKWVYKGVDVVFLDHKYGSARDFDYHFGLIDGVVDEVKYGDKVVQSKSVSLYYMDEDVSVTLWALPLEHDTDFDISKLTY